MKFGYFDDLNREYVMNTPKTPFPWINYLGQDGFFSLISNTAGGYCFYKDARLRRLTRYRYNSIPWDNGGRYLYVNDSGKVYSLTWMPVKNDAESFECRHGLGYTKIKCLQNKLESEVLYFVPLKENAELHHLRLVNRGDEDKEITLFSFIEFCLWNAYDDMTNYQRTFNTGAVEVEESTIFHKTDYRERRNHYSFYSVNRKIDGFDTDRDSFLGRYNGLHEPEAVLEGKSRNSIAEGWNPIASHEIRIKLKPGEQTTLIFVLGYGENGEYEKWESKGRINKSKAFELIEKYKDDSSVERAFKELRKHWDGLLSGYQLFSSEEKLNRMVNIWNPYQCMITFNLSRSASYFETGIGRGIGFRDSNQDVLGFVHMIPDKARSRILELSGTMLEDGGAYHQYQPLTGKGNNEIGGKFNDDPLWMILSTLSYIKETGDYSILDEKTPYNCDANKLGTLKEHLEKALEYTLKNLGPHGLPLIVRADWNDCLNLNCFSINPDESFQTCSNRNGKTAESVFIAGLFAYVGREFGRLCRLLGYDEQAAGIEEQVNKMRDSIMKYGYDKNWFLRAYDYFGNRIGSAENEEGQLFIEPQGICVMADIGLENGMALKALDSVHERLNTRYGLVLQDPAYSGYKLNLGEISSYPPGLKENAGVFCHNNPWIMIAETRMGRGSRAFEYYSKIAPAYIEDISDIHKMEPYVYAQMIAGKDTKNPGEAKNSWLTGTAAWNYEAITKWILGIRPDFEGLIIDPCIPEEWDGFKVIRKFRNAAYSISVKNPEHVSKGVKRVRIDGKDAASNLIPVFNDELIHDIEVIMG